MSGIATRTRSRTALLLPSLPSSPSGVSSSRGSSGGDDHPSATRTWTRGREGFVDDDEAGETSRDRGKDSRTMEGTVPAFVGRNDGEEVILLVSSEDEDHDSEKFWGGKRVSGAKKGSEEVVSDRKMCGESSGWGRLKTVGKGKTAKRKGDSSSSSENEDGEEENSEREDRADEYGATNEASPSGHRCRTDSRTMKGTSSTVVGGSNGDEEEDVILLVDSGDESFDEFWVGFRSMRREQEVVSDRNMCAEGVEGPGWGKRRREEEMGKRNPVKRRREFSSSDGEEEDKETSNSEEEEEEADDYEGEESDDGDADEDDDDDDCNDKEKQEDHDDKDDVSVNEAVDLVSSNDGSGSEDYGDSDKKTINKNFAGTEGVVGRIKFHEVKPGKARDKVLEEVSCLVNFSRNSHHPTAEEQRETSDTSFDYVEEKESDVNDYDMKRTGKKMDILENYAASIGEFSCIAKRTRLSFRKFFANRSENFGQSGCIDVDEVSLRNEDDSGDNDGGSGVDSDEVDSENEDGGDCNCNDKRFGDDNHDDYDHLGDDKGVAIRRCGMRIVNDKISRKWKHDGGIHIDNDGVAGATDPFLHIREKKNVIYTTGKASDSVADVSLFDILVETITNRRDLLFENVKCKPSEEKHQGKEKEPSRFSFEELELQFRKPDRDEELNDVWDDLNFVLGSEKIDYSDLPVKKVESTVDMLQSTSNCNLKICQHEFLLDEQIGIVCRICRIVKREIKYCMPPMINRVYGMRSRKVSLEEEDVSVWGVFDCQKLKDHDLDSNSFHGRTVWDLIPDLKEKMFKHQKEGFEFIWKNLAGSIFLEKLKSTDSDDIGGCLISHAPGTGKTLLTIAFIQSFLHVFDDCRPMVVAPVTLLPTWEREFKKWDVEVPFHILNYNNLSGKENRSALELFLTKRSKLGHTRRQNLRRVIKIFSWISSKSVLGISYGMFRKLTMEKNPSDKEALAITKLLLHYPGLLVLDEGHTARNRKSRVWQCLKRVKTQRRIMLSGTPFQNDFVQFFNTLYVIRPNFAEGISESFKNRQCGLFVNQIPREDLFQEKNEEILRHTFATFSEGIKPQENSAQLKELRSIIDPFIHVHERTNHDLPGLRDYFVYLCLSDLQKCIFDKLIKGSSFDYDHKVSCISVHPSILLKINDEKDQAVIQEHHSDLRNGQANDGVKLRFVIELVQLCEALNEKVAVFSQFIHPLSIIEAHLTSFFGWTVGRELLHLDGRILDQKHRQSLIRSFNMSKEVKVILVSTKVCAEGIDLTGASRVVLLDLVWNPSVRRQAIGRAYRIGQQKVVYAYNLIASATLEERKYSVQDIKDKFSQLVFATSSKNVTLIDSMKDCTDKVLAELIERHKASSLFQKVFELESCQEN